ncbi:GspH/FimT family pseudopilin [Pseudomonas sp. CAU 1711]|uniref:GspH/FimT family pseudopilin n=1 Tax=Pseudomonas sp. CAU 1711 TaxID=3140356 RepID=UPI003260070B
MRNTGFSLLEMLTALAVAAVLTLIAIPLIDELLARQRTSTALRSFTDSLKYARTHAVLHQTGVTMRAQQQDDWGAGWLVFEDPNHNARHDSEEKTLLQRIPGEGLVIRGNRPVSSYIHFNMLGEPQLTGGGFQAGTVTICSPHAPEKHSQLIMARSGRLRLSSKIASSCP